MSMIMGKNLTDKDFPIFDNIREITGSMLIYQVNGLTSLGKMFPNLRIIGGHSLIMNYALVIYQNRDLVNIGFDKLTVIRNGGIRITENPKLCYVKFVNWDAILIGKIRDVIIETGTSQAFSGSMQRSSYICKEREGCNVQDTSKCHTVNEITSCWNNTTCQARMFFYSLKVFLYINFLVCSHQRNINGTVGPGCNPSGERCHHECIGGCEKPDDPASCHGCRHVEDNGVCLRTCPPDKYEQLENRCVTKEECSNKLSRTSLMKPDEDYVWKPFNGKCHHDCPAGYQEGINFSQVQS